MNILKTLFIAISAMLIVGLAYKLYPENNPAKSQNAFAAKTREEACDTTISGLNSKCDSGVIDHDNCEFIPDGSGNLKWQDYTISGNPKHEKTTYGNIGDPHILKISSNDGKEFVAGTYITFNTTPGKTYCASWRWGPNTDSNPANNPFEKTLGLDPSGSTNPTASTIVWGSTVNKTSRLLDYDPVGVDTEYNADIKTVATGNTMTLFVKAHFNAVQDSFIQIDQVNVFDEGVKSTTGTVTPTITPANTTPTATTTPVPTQQAGVCPTTSNNQYETHETDSTSVENGLEAPVHPHKNINVYGYQLVQTGTKALFDKSGLPQDAKAPQFSTVFSYSPTVVNLYKIYDWDSNQGPHLANDEVSMIGVGTNPGDVLHVPDAKFNLDTAKEEYGGPLVIVLYADDKSITLKYTLQDDIVVHYTTYIDNICVDPNLLSTYKSADSGERWQNNQQARRRLPVLKGRQVIGTAKDKEVRLAVRNSGDVVDPRWKNGWWRDNPTSGGGGNNGPTTTPLPTSYCSSSTKPEMETAELPTSYPGKINIKWKKPNGVSKYTLKIDDMTSPFDDTCTSSNTGDVCVNDINANTTSYQFDGEEGHSYHIILSPIDVCGQTGTPGEQIISAYPAVSGNTCRIQGYRAVVGPIDQSNLKTSEGYYIDTTDANKSESIWVNDAIKSAKVTVSGVTPNKSYQNNPYSFVLPVGSNYTVSIDSVSGYNIYSKLSTEQNQTAQCSAISISNSQTITVNCSPNQVVKLWWYFVPNSIPTTALTPTNSPPTPTPTAIPEISYCKEVQVNSQDKSNKLDIVILPDGYKTDTTSITGSDVDIQAAMTDAKTAVDNFNQTNLSSQNKSKFNFWVNVNLGHDYEVKPNCNQVAGGHSVPCWNRDKAKDVQRLCEGDAYIVLKKSTYDSLIQTWKVAGLSYIGSKEALVFGGQMESTPHELCHAIAKCNDEYSYGVNASNGDKPEYNCSEEAATTQQAPCPKWSRDGLTNAKCIQKCTFNNWYKSIDKSTMINQVESHDFSPPSLLMWENALKEYK